MMIEATACIWRYMDLSKFVAMLQKRTLYFSRADLLGDPFEGSLPTKNVQRRIAEYESYVENYRPDFEKLNPHLRDYEIESTVRLIASEKFGYLDEDPEFDLREHTYISCWHLNEHESAAMWRLYAKSEDAVAILSTYCRLRNCLPNPITIKALMYADYINDEPPINDAYERFFYKRTSFAHEREIRAVFFIKPDYDIIRNEDDDIVESHLKSTSAGKNIRVDLNDLIENIFVAPTAPRWFVDVVTKLAETYEITAKVSSSSMSGKPLF